MLDDDFEEQPRRTVNRPHSMGKHDEIGEISEATRAEVRDDWVVTRCVSRTAQKIPAH
jgi:hypothetical protein